MKPRPTKPRIIIAQVEGSGVAAPTTMVFNATASSRENQAVPPPPAIPPAKFTLPLSRAAEILLKVTPGPPYPLGSPPEHPIVEQAPSPSKPKRSTPGDERWSDANEVALLLITPK